MLTNRYFRLAMNILTGILLGVLISQLLSGCSNTPVLAPPPSAGIAGDAARQPTSTATPSSNDSIVVEPDSSAIAAKANADGSAKMPLAQTRERYQLSWDGKLEGEATRQLSCNAANCRFETEATVVGLASLREVSDFHWAQGHVEFQRYERTVQLLFKQVVRIEKQNDGRIRAERRGKVYDYASQPGLVDLLTIEVQLRADRLAGRTPKASYALADSKGISAISLHREANETLTLAGKARPCEVYVRQDGKRTTTLWLDPAQDFLPLQIVHQDGAETYRMVWQGD